ncbi:chain-length determining protein [Brevundimonas sp. TWP2-3-4b1]|uniref:chain-length determining protein n=1 Tax=Brevundimonas sp. TWP2-3-4b1 TaxID=2804580 RepID=UPI003CF4EEE4
MTTPELNYVGPIPKALTFNPERPVWWKRVPWPFIVIVVLPTIVAIVYFLFIASPRYVSEAQFTVRSATRSQPSSLGAALQGVGLSVNSSDAFAVHEYISSRDAMRELQRRNDLIDIFGSRQADFWTRYPAFGESRSEEGLYKAFQRFVEVGYDSTTGISTLRVEAFSAAEARNLTEGLLQGGEQLINRLNERSADDAVSYAVSARDQARDRLAEAQAGLTSLRNNQQFIDPELSARESSQLIGSLRATIATLMAERSQLASEAPSSPQLPVLDSRIASYNAQVAAERSKVTGGAGSLASQVGVYERLTLNQELADREYANASAQLISAQQEARRQKLYLDRIVSPNMPDRPAQPKRLLSILAVFGTAILVYGIGWMVWSGVREHRQD